MVAHAKKYLTLVVEINASISNLQHAKEDCIMLASIALGERTIIVFADESPLFVVNSKPYESILNIPDQSKKNFPLCWEQLFSTTSEKAIVGDNIGIPVIKRNPIANMLFIYLEVHKSILGINDPRAKYFFVRELCPPLISCYKGRLGSLSNIIDILRIYHASMNQKYVTETFNINIFVDKPSIERSRQKDKVTFLLLTNNKLYNERMLRCIERSLSRESNFIFIAPHPKMPCNFPPSANIGIINTRGLCAEILVKLIAEHIEISNSSITIAGSSSALLLFAREGSYNYRIMKNHLRPLTSKSDLFRYFRLLTFERLCRKVSP